MHRSLARSAAVVLAAFLLASCSSTSSNRLTKQELIKKGDVICKTWSDKAEPISADLAYPTEKNLPQWADALGKMAPIFQEMTTGLKNLKPPEADQKMWDQITAGLDQELAAINQAAQAATNDDLTGMMSALKKGSSVASKTGKIAVDYGFKQCGSQGST